MRSAAEAAANEEVVDPAPIDSWWCSMGWLWVGAGASSAPIDEPTGARIRSVMVSNTGQGLRGKGTPSRRAEDHSRPIFGCKAEWEDLLANIGFKGRNA